MIRRRRVNVPLRSSAIRGDLSFHRAPTWHPPHRKPNLRVWCVVTCLTTCQCGGGLKQHALSNSNSRDRGVDGTTTDRTNPTGKRFILQPTSDLADHQRTVAQADIAYQGMFRTTGPFGHGHARAHHSLGDCCTPWYMVLYGRTPLARPAVNRNRWSRSQPQSVVSIGGPAQHAGQFHRVGAGQIGEF